MNQSFENNELADAWEWFETFSKKWWRMSVIALIILLAIALKTCGQERGKTDSVWKLKNSTCFMVMVRVNECVAYEIEYNSHCWRCKDVSIVPERWDIYTKKNKRVIIKAVL